MTPVQALLAARRAGIQITVRDGQLVARPSSALDEDLRAALKEHRERLIQLLSLDTRPHWRTFDGHDCWTGCDRADHPVCNACGLPLTKQWLHWPHLHPECQLERLD